MKNNWLGMTLVAAVLLGACSPKTGGKQVPTMAGATDDGMVKVEARLEPAAESGKFVVTLTYQNKSPSDLNFHFFCGNSFDLHGLAPEPAPRPCPGVHSGSFPTNQVIRDQEVFPVQRVIDWREISVVVSYSPKVYNASPTPVTLNIPLRPVGAENGR